MTIPRPFKLIDFSIPKNLEKLKNTVKTFEDRSDHFIATWGSFEGTEYKTYKFKVSTWCHTLLYIERNYPEYTL